MYIAFDTFHPLRISMHLVQHQSSIVSVGVDSNVKFSFSFLKLNPHYLVLKALMAIVFIKWKCSTMAIGSLTITAQMELTLFYASFVLLIQQFKS
jgi:hypothetical protein